MKNIFILYMAPGNLEQMVHYEDTIKNKVSQARIFKYISDDLKNKLRDVFGSHLITTWGSRNTDTNRAKFERMQPGDDILIIEGNTIKLLGKFAAKTINPDLSRELWKNIKGKSIEGWDLIYFIANPLEIDLPFDHFKTLFNYSQNWSLRGFTNISEDKLEKFYAKYDDLYSILQKIKVGKKIEERKGITIQEENKQAEETQNNIDDLLNDEEVSDHIIMQWKLVRLGLKTGSKVWIPKKDQLKITQNYQFSEFEKEFTAGLDTPAKYVENIDVVWKEEYRIDAAFEVENTTAIYSGLLRFSDLKIVAPNSPYPLFIVAPVSKKKRLLDQINRPTFKKMEFEKKVRYLSYEAVNEVDKFFENTNTGLNVKVLFGKSEIIN